MANDAGSPVIAETTVPADATKPADAVPSNTTDFSAEIARASSPAQMAALIDKMQRTTASPAKAVEKTAGEKPAETKPAAAAEEVKPATETKPAGEGTPAAEEEAKPEGEAAAETTAEEQVPEDGADSDLPITAITAKRAHLRLPPDTDQEGRLALAFMKRNRDWPLSQALAAARKQLGITPEADAKPEVEKPVETKPAAANTGLPEDIGGVDTEIDRLETEREKATTDLRFDDVAKLDRQLRKLDRHRNDLVRKTEREEVEKAGAQEAEYNKQFDASSNRAAELYDFTSDPKSEGHKRMIEVEEAIRKNGDPLYFSPNKPLVIAQMVARELRVAPKTAKAAAKLPVTTAAKPGQPATEKPKSVIPAGGSSTTPATTDSQGKFAESVTKITSLGDLKKFARSTGINLPI